MVSVAARIVKGSLWISGSRAAVNVIALIGTLALARLLVPSDFGLVALGSTILAIVRAVTDLSLSSALVQHSAPNDEHFHTAFTLNFTRGILLAIIICATSGPLASLYEEPRLEPLLYALSASVLLGGMSNPRTVMLSRQLVFWQEFLLGVAERLVTTGVAIAIAYYYRSYWALVAGAIAGQAAMVVLSYAIMPYRPRVGLKHARELWSFSIWLTLGQAMNTVNWRFDQLLVGGLLGRTALGFYSVGDNLAATVTREATSPLTRTLFPAFSQIADAPDRLRAGYQRAQRLVTAVALPIGVGFAFVAQPFVLAAMGEKWLPVVPVIQGLSANFALQTLGTLAGPLALAKGETRLLFIRDCQMFLMRLPLVTAGMIMWGLIGIVYARTFGTFIGIWINLRTIRQLTGLSAYDQIKANVRAITAVVFMAIGLLFVVPIALTPNQSLGSLINEIALIVVAGAALYMFSSAGLWAIAGRPAGPEADLLEIGSGLVRRAVFPRRV